MSGMEGEVADTHAKESCSMDYFSVESFRDLMMAEFGLKR